VHFDNSLVGIRETCIAFLFSGLLTVHKAAYRRNRSARKRLFTRTVLLFVRENAQEGEHEFQKPIVNGFNILA